jgi:MFS family permease
VGWRWRSLPEVIALCTLFSAAASVTYGKLKQRMEFVTFLPIIFGFMGIGYLLIGQSSNWAQVLTGLAISGMGLGILMPNMSVWLSGAVPDAMRGRALGGLSTSMFLGQFLSPFAKRVRQHNRHSTIDQIRGLRRYLRAHWRWFSSGCLGICRFQVSSTQFDPFSCYLNARIVNFQIFDDNPY